MLGKLASLVGLGRIAATRDDAPVRVAQVRLSEVETRDRTAMMQHYGFSSRPHPGADTAHICLNGDRSRMVIIATHDQRYFLPLAEGEVAIHDDLGRSVVISRAGIVINSGGVPVVLNGDLQVTGNITDNTAANAHTVAQMRGIFNAHTHAAPAGGGATTVPGTPQ